MGRSASCIPDNFIDAAYYKHSNWIDVRIHFVHFSQNRFRKVERFEFSFNWNNSIFDFQFGNWRKIDMRFLLALIFLGVLLPVFADAVGTAVGRSYARGAGAVGASGDQTETPMPLRENG